jgi:argininosuccinate lyase
MTTEDGSDDAGASDEETVVRRERFGGGPAREFLSSMDADRHIFAADLAVDRAHVVMLAEQGIVGAEAAGDILRALDAVESAGFDALPAGEDVHEAIETAVVERAGDAGGRMHTARSRNDEVATCLRYRVRGDLLDAAEATLDFRAALREAAAEHAGTVMPGYTHLQPAQPTTVGHFLLSYESAVGRDTERLLDAHDRTNRSPLGAAAFAGTPYDVDRERTAELLGFEGVLENAMDAAAARDFLVESVAALAALATAVSGLAEDLVVLANRGLVEIDDDYASTSSIMPQKKNPDTLELVRATAGEATGALQGLATTLKGLPRAYNRDLQSATPHAWRAFDAVPEAVAVAGGAVATAAWPTDALREAAGEGFATATGVADLLAMGGLPFRTAHEVVAAVAEKAADPDVEDVAAAVEAVTGEELGAYADPEAVERALDPAASVAMRDSPGGPAPERVAAAVERAAECHAEDEAAVTRRRESAVAAAATLQREVERYV